MMSPYKMVSLPYSEELLRTCLSFYLFVFWRSLPLIFFVVLWSLLNDHFHSYGNPITPLVLLLRTLKFSTKKLLTLNQWYVFDDTVEGPFFFSSSFFPSLSFPSVEFLCIYCLKLQLLKHRLHFLLSVDHTVHTLRYHTTSGVSNWQYNMGSKYLVVFGL